ncbi:squamous cell carcinoma antigen recognized by T-cells 3 isoform X2 [Eurytemora carolleeae]|uniref:squamous cell carcinoma antigen recognized by T-cells 3 isoform X2 n=1 Tax=Eurytemora carolleeae TaxID=1294199 RepID=UPI000C76242F|nr:squamous cell carcinoma antigen recognized by T-cells 3 isoform X2 [Eurytemora carolleeae]|eukprot:XP_023326445.1 squamous cell carcinoma antigen recognized by T-cells 3-like isoform X2 [Eurytemora affinis]
MSKRNLDEDMEAEVEGLEDSEEEKEEEEKEEDSDNENMEDDEEFDQETLEKISRLEAEIQENPYNYNPHTELISILRKGSDFTRLRECRERFAKLYPLSADLWIEWTQDEMKIASTEEDKMAVIQLFERGVKDYSSVDLWLEYCQFSIGGIGTPDGIATARSIYERSLTACGLHAGKGALLWESFRELESALLALQGTPSTPEQIKQHTAQKERIINLFKRQLRVPHLGIEDTFREYMDVAGTDSDANVLRDYEKAKEKLKLREDFEIRVSEKETSLDAYKEYIQFELKEKDPVRIQLVYERCITDHCLESDIWSEYLNYLDTTLGIDSVSLPVYERAVRNCPWEKNIWADYIRALERYEKDHSAVLKTFEESLLVGFTDPTAYLEVWLAYLDYTRRRTEFEKEETESMQELRIVFNRACEHLERMGGDPECEVLKYYANLEADQFRNMENARKLWTDILQVHQFKGSVWMECIQFEKIFGDKKHLRKRYERALEKTHDTPEIVAKSWLQFEREEGSLDAFEQCRKLIKIKMEKISAVRDKENRSKQEEDYQLNAKIEKKKEKDKQHRRDKRHQASSARKTTDQSESQPTQGFKMPASPASASKTVSAPPGFVPPKSVAPPPGYKGVEPPPGFKPSEGSEPPAKKARVEDTDEAKQLRTVFLSNLDFEVTENQIAEILGSSGSVREVRLVKHPNGKSRGFAFVEFETPEEAEGTLKRDNELINGRPIYISQCDPSKKKAPVFKYTTGLEKNKLFVKGLDQSITKEELSKLFAEYGELQDVRLVTYRNGHSKGLAFVEYKDEVNAAKALVKTDGMKVKDKEIQVALSNPPKRKEEGEPVQSQANVRSLGGTTQKDGFGPRGKGRSQVDFVPRSISVPAKPDPKLLAMKFVRPAGSKDQENGNGTGTGDGTGNGTSESSAAAEPKSNKDFRQMLLGSK